MGEHMKRPDLKKLLMTALLMFFLILDGVCAGDYTVTCPKYRDVGRYITGGGEIKSRINTVYINWICGSVKVEYYDGKNVIVQEKGNVSLYDKIQVRYRIRGHKLYIQYFESGFTYHGTRLEKDLVVKIPAGRKLKVLDINSISADLDIEEIKCNKFISYSTTGNTNVKFSNIPSSVNIESISGEITLVSEGLKTSRFTTTSGNIHVTSRDKVKVLYSENISGSTEISTGRTYKATIRSTSGFVVYSAKNLDSINTSTVSSGITILADKVGVAKVSSTSGNITVYLDADLGFDADIRASDYTVDSDYVQYDISRYGCRVKSGSAKPGDLRLDSLTGKITITKK